MKKIILLMSALLVSTASFAAFDKGSDSLKALGSAFKKQSKTAVELKKDLNIVYGGADLSSNTSLAADIA